MVISLTDGCDKLTRIKWSSFLHLTNSLRFRSASRRYYISGTGITQTSLEIQFQLCLSGFMSKSSKFYKYFVSTN